MGTGSDAQAQAKLSLKSQAWACPFKEVWGWAFLLDKNVKFLKNLTAYSQWATDTVSVSVSADISVWQIWENLIDYQYRLSADEKIHIGSLPILCNID